MLFLSSSPMCSATREEHLILTLAVIFDMAKKARTWHKTLCRGVRSYKYTCGHPHIFNIHEYRGGLAADRR